jgi:phosphonate transport system substrate-binding protein
MAIFQIVTKWASSVTRLLTRAGTLWILILWLPAGSIFAEAMQNQPVDLQPPRDYLVFGFLPIVSPERLVDRFSPLVKYLSSELNTEIRMQTAPDFSQFVHRTQNERRYDILFTAPHLYYLASKRAGYRAVVRVDQDSMQAVIVAPTRSDIRSIDDLANKRLATTGSLALSTLLARQLLSENDLDPDEDLSLVATPSHSASILSAYQGTTDAATLMLPVYRRVQPHLRQGTVIIAYSHHVPHIPIAVAPWVDASVATRIQAALAAMRSNKDGRAVLQSLEWPGFISADDDTYETLGEIVNRIEVE